MTVQLLHGDCLELMQDIPDHSVDAIICDLPYGTTACKWDSVIPFEPLWAQYKRVLKPLGNVLAFGAFPFTVSLAMSNLEWLKYELIWDKGNSANFFHAKYRPLMYHENILLFTEGGTASGSVRAATYNPQGLIEVNKKASNKNKTGNFFGGPKGHSVFDKAETYNQKYTNYPTSILSFPGEVSSTHPTQKPLALLEWISKTYSNEGDTILDNCMGSGTTGVACVNTNRNFIGIEKDLNYFRVALERINTIQNLPITKTTQNESLIIKQFSMFDGEKESA